MKIMRRYGKVITMSAAALAMTAALTVESSMAYFTTYAEAEGSHGISLGAKTDITETVSDKTKHVVVQNTSESNECFVRVRVFSGRQVVCTPQGDGWSEGQDGYWYYGPVLAPSTDKENSVTTPLDVSINIDGLGEDPDSFNVVIIQECTPAIYGEDGAPGADWDAVYTDFKDNTGRKEADN